MESTPCLQPAFNRAKSENLRRPGIAGGGGRGIPGLMFAGYVLLASQSPHPFIVYRIFGPNIDPTLVTLWNI